MSNYSDQKIEVQNVNIPGHTNKVDAQKYTATKKALLKVLPHSKPGLTHKEIQEKILPYLPESLFPGGAKIGWWSKTVQLDLEAKGIIIRETTKPLAWYKK